MKTMKDSHQPPRDAKEMRHDAIAAYAAEVAGTDLDLDLQLESAGIEQLVLSPRE